MSFPIASAFCSGSFQSMSRPRLTLLAARAGALTGRELTRLAPRERLSRKARRVVLISASEATAPR
jgi:hypothetical protein